MTLLSEMVRNLSAETNYVNDSTAYSRAANAAYGAIRNYGNVTLASAGLLAIYFEAFLQSYGGDPPAFYRVKVGSVYAYAIRQTLDLVIAYSCLVYLEAGTYGVLVESACQFRVMYIRNFRAGYVSFNDLQGSALAAYAGAVAKTTTVRATPLGGIKNTVYCITVDANTAAAATNMENPGDAFTNGVQVLLDGVQLSWSERWQADVAAMDSGGKCYVAASAGVNHSFTVTKDNANTTLNVSVVVCPWILPLSLAEIVTLSLTQGSTVYVTEEPLDANPTKYVYVGKVRAITFGVATDYYSSASAVGISTFSYTFESVNASQCLLQVYGLGGCISIIAVDIR